MGLFTTYLAYREGSRWAGGQSNSSSWQPAGLQRGYRSHGDIKTTKFKTAKTKGNYKVGGVFATYMA
jgi:hypothetical protein